MKMILKLGPILAMFCMICGCGGGGGVSQGESSAGSLVFKMDLSTLTAKTAPKAAAALTPITSATVTLTRDSFQPIEVDLTVIDNIAEGRADNLSLGYWHVTVRIFSGAAEIYTGESDAKVLAGVDVQVKVLFDPTPAEASTGSLSFAVSANPMPGYRAIDQQVSKPLFSEKTGKIYILDNAARMVGVYDAETMNREKDISLSTPPMSISLDFAGDTLLLGYPSGQIYRLDPATSALTLLADILSEVYCMAAMSDKVLIAVGNGGNGSEFNTIELTTGQVLDTESYWYSFSDVVLNRTNGVAYLQSIDVSPSDLYRIQVDQLTGVITEIADSPYHGDYNLGSPLRIIKNGTRVATAAGTTFSSSSLAGQDLLYNGSINYRYADLVADDTLGYLYLLNNTTATKLMIINQSNFFLEKTIELLGEPEFVFQTATSIIVLTTNENAYYAKVFAKHDLGLN